MKKVFEENILSGIKLKNRIVRSATNEGLADENGFPREIPFTLYKYKPKSED